MNEDRFDSLTRLVATAMPRRRALRALAGLVAGGVAARIGSSEQTRAAGCPSGTKACQDPARGTVCCPGTKCYPSNPHAVCCPGDQGLCCGRCVPWGAELNAANCTGAACSQGGGGACPSGQGLCCGKCVPWGPNVTAANCTGTACSAAKTPVAQISLLGVPSFAQAEQSWSCDQLGTCPANCPAGATKCKWGTCPGSTIGGYGCFVTSLAMLFNHYQSGFTDPGKLNQQLTANGGFSSGCLINWGAIKAPIAPSGIAFRSFDASANKWKHLDQELAAGHPVLAEVSNTITSLHMVVVIGKIGDSYRIRDAEDGALYTWSPQFKDGALAGSSGYTVGTFVFVD